MPRSRHDRVQHRHVQDLRLLRPLVLIILSLVVFWFKVKIDEKMHAQIVEELEAKLASGEIVDDEAQAVIKN